MIKESEKQACFLLDVFTLRKHILIERKLREEESFFWLMPFNNIRIRLSVFN